MSNSARKASRSRNNRAPLALTLPAPVVDLSEMLAEAEAPQTVRLAEGDDGVFVLRGSVGARWVTLWNASEAAAIEANDEAALWEAWETLARKVAIDADEGERLIEFIGDRVPASLMAPVLGSLLRAVTRSPLSPTDSSNASSGQGSGSGPSTDTPPAS